METLYEEVSTTEIFDYHVLAFEKKWTEVFGNPIKFKIMLDKTGKLHLVSTKSTYDVTGIRPVPKKVRSTFKKSTSGARSIKSLENG